MTTKYHLKSTDEEGNLKVSKFHKIIFGEDQLTAARARTAIQRLAKGNDAASKLLGLVPIVEDWHTRQLMLVVSYNLYWRLVMVIIYHFILLLGYLEALLFCKILW